MKRTKLFICFENDQKKSGDSNKIPPFFFLFIYFLFSLLFVVLRVLTKETEKFNFIFFTTYEKVIKFLGKMYDKYVFCKYFITGHKKKLVLKDFK